MRVPECEVLMPTNAVKNFIRNRDFFKIISAVETGGEHGMWSFQRYRTWLDNRRQWNNPDQNPEPPDSEPAESLPSAPAMPALTSAAPKAAEKKPKSHGHHESGRIEIEPVEGEFGKILKKSS